MSRTLGNSLIRLRDILMGYQVAGGFHAEEALLRAEHRVWIDHPAIAGIGICSNVTNGSKPSGLTIYLDEDSTDQAPLPSSIESPALGRIPLVVRRGATPVAQGFQAMERPIRPGASISHVNDAAGTACMVVRKTVGAHLHHRYLLSAEHVLCDVFERDGADAIVQPAKEDSPYAGRLDQIAHQLQRVNLFANGVNEIDAAIALLLPGVEMTNRPLGCSFQIRDFSTRHETQAPVLMVGRTSELQPGKILDPSVNTKISYRSAAGRQRVLRFRNVVRCDYQSAGGDSGAPVVHAGTKQLLGLHIAGTAGASYYCKIDRVFSILQIGLP